ncbi:uncharacterized protein LOC126675369 isoform X2 [Mercurialis annua]|nr:uncharacterized protein LOC126675369 isoform X2 [Mercurialis annua]
MEDQARDWENQGYEEKNESWIWDKGLSLGKKILFTGLVMSSAPVVIPPLMVMSAVGLACSVPYGIFLASYACTDKLMRKLLPTPRISTPEEKYGGEDSEFAGDYDVENKEEELKRRLEIGPELDEQGNEEEKSPKKIKMTDEEMEREEVVEEPVVLKIKDEGAEISGVTIAIEESEKTGSEEVPVEVASISVEIRSGDDKEEKQVLVKETTRDEVVADEEAGKEKQSEETVQGGAEEGLKKEDERNAGEAVIESEDKNAVGVETEKTDRKVEQNGHKTNPAVENEPAVQKEKVSDERGGGDDKIGAGEPASFSAGGKTQNKKKKKANRATKDLNKDKEIAVSSNADEKKAPEMTEGTKQPTESHEVIIDENGTSNE